jgi:F-type H+-transporting ATPase subunit b
MNRMLRIAVFVSLLSLALGLGFAQEKPAEPAPSTSQTEPTKQAPVQPEASTPGRDLARASEAGEPASRREEEDEENVGLKQSPVVKKIGAKLGLSPVAAYWVFWCLNFAIVVGVILWFVKSKLVGSLRERTSLIRKSMDEAKKASDTAMSRLKDIENRLARLDGEVAELKGHAEKDFKAEEQRIQAAAADDARRVVEFAETEISAAAKAARRELKSFAAELAVNLAEKKIQVDPQTDQRLVSTFVNDLGKDGK